MNDAVSITRDLVRCPSVTPADAGALGVLERLLKDAGFDVHRVTFSEPGTADVDNLYARWGEPWLFGFPDDGAASYVRREGLAVLSDTHTVQNICIGFVR